MTSGGSVTNAPVYFGPPLGMYEVAGFDRFVRGEVRTWMERNEIPNQFSVEENGIVRIYHFPEAKLGIHHTTYDENRCKVNLTCTSLGRETLDGLFRFIMKREKETNLGIPLA